MRTNPCYLASKKLPKSTEIEFNLTNLLLSHQDKNLSNYQHLSSIACPDQTCNGMQSWHLGFGRPTKKKNINVNGVKNERQKGPINLDGEINQSIYLSMKAARALMLLMLEV